MILLTLAVMPQKKNLLNQFFISHLKLTVITLLKGMSISLGGFDLEHEDRYVMKIQSFHYCLSLFVPKYSYLYRPPQHSSPSYLYPINHHSTYYADITYIFQTARTLQNSSRQETTTSRSHRENIRSSLPEVVPSHRANSPFQLPGHLSLYDVRDQCHLLPARDFLHC